MNESFYGVHIENGTFFSDGNGRSGFGKLATLNKSMGYWTNKSKYKIYRTYINNGVPVTERVE